MLKRRKNRPASVHGNTLPRMAELVPHADLARPMRLAFISDLHLFSSRCHYDRHEPAIRRALEASDVCVWGGDLFDFCWSQLGDGEQSRRAAVDWLEDWRSEFPDKVFVYLNGNHDAQAKFRDSLSEWAKPHARSGDQQHQNLSPVTKDSVKSSEPTRLSLRPGAIHVGWDALRFADTLLVHGDVMEGGNHDMALAQYRHRWSHEPNTSPANLQNGLYDAAVTARLHLAAASVVHRRRSTCLRLLHWARQQPAWLHHDLKRIVFGHTHRHINGVRVAGIDFYNGGAAVRHVKFDPVLLQVSCRD